PPPRRVRVVFTAMIGTTPAPLRKARRFELIGCPFLRVASRARSALSNQTTTRACHFRAPPAEYRGRAPAQRRHALARWSRRDGIVSLTATSPEDSEWAGQDSNLRHPACKAPRWLTQAPAWRFSCLASRT